MQWRWKVKCCGLLWGLWVLSQQRKVIERFHRRWATWMIYIFSFWEKNILEMGENESRENGQEAITRGTIYLKSGQFWEWKGDFFSLDQDNRFKPGLPWPNQDRWSPSYYSPGNKQLWLKLWWGDWYAFWPWVAYCWISVLDWPYLVLSSIDSLAMPYLVR